MKGCHYCHHYHHCCHHYALLTTFPLVWWTVFEAEKRKANNTWNENEQSGVLDRWSCAHIIYASLNCNPIQVIQEFDFLCHTFLPPFTFKWFSVHLPTCFNRHFIYPHSNNWTSVVPWLSILTYQEACGGDGIDSHLSTSVGRFM